MDKYKELNRIKCVNDILNEEEYLLSDVAFIMELLRKILRRKKRKLYYMNKVKEKRRLIMKKRKNKPDKLFLDWLLDNKKKYIKIAKKYDGWLSSSKLKELYIEFSNEIITSWGFVNEIKEKYGDNIYGMKRYNSGKQYRAINLSKILKMNGYDEKKQLTNNMKYDNTMKKQGKFFNEYI